MKRTPVLLSLLFAIILSFLASPARAALIDRGNGLIYDSDLDITWPQNANLAATYTFGVSGIHASGEMNWQTARNWVAAMNAAHYLGHSNWRLPLILPVNGPVYNPTFSYNGASDYSYNLSAPGSAYPLSTQSELAYMYYINLGNKGIYNVDGNTNSYYGVTNAGPFINLATLPPPNAPTKWVIFWSDNTYDEEPNTSWSFRFDYGSQAAYENQSHGFFVWPVLPGDPAGPDAAPAIMLSQTTLNFNSLSGSNPASQSITVANTGGGTLVWNVAADNNWPAWLSVSPDSGTGAATLTVSVNSAGLSPGTYTKTFAVSFNGSENLPDTVSVNLTVYAPMEHYDFNYQDRTALLSAGWSFLAVTPSWGSRNTEQTTGAVVSYDQSAHPGILRIPADGGDLWGEANNSRNTLLRSLNENWTSLRLKLSFAPSQNYQLAGLLAYQDDDNYAHVTRIFNGANRIDFVRELYGYPTSLKSAAETATDVTLRLDRDLSTQNISATYSQNGSSWVSLGSTKQTLLNPKLAILVGASPEGFPNADLSWAEVDTAATPPAIQLSTPNIYFSSQSGTSPSSRTLILSNSGGGTLNWTVTADGESPAWLSVGPGSGNGNASLSVSANTAGLLPGTYNKVITITAPGATNSPRSVNVVLTVNTPPPSISLSTKNLNFSAVSGTNPANQSVAISNGGGGILVWSATTNGGSPAWLIVSPGSGAGNANLTASVNSSGLVPGTYTKTITITASGAANSPQSINVTLTVTPPPPTIQLSSSSLAFSTVQGTNPANQTISISNSGGSTMNWTATANSVAPAWLSVSPGSGTQNGVLSISVNSSALAPGTYTKTITVAAAGATNTPRTVNVTLTITALPVISLNPPSLSFTTIQGSNQGTQLVSVSNAGGGTLNWTATADATAPSWLSVSPAGGTGNGTLKVSVDSSGLAPGTYTKSVTIAASGSTNTPQTINVSFTVYASNTVVYAANSGGGQYTDPSGVVYKADAENSGGYTASTGAAITGTSADALYQTERYGDFSYTVPLSNGDYVVTLRFAEIYWDASGRRVFNVNMQGSQVISNLDIFARVGKNAAYDVSVPVSVTNGKLNINFTSVSDYALVSAILVTQSQSIASPSIALNPTSLNFSAASGTNPSNQTINISNSGGGTLNWTAAAGSTSPAWLSVGPASGTGSSAITVSVNSSGLNPGTYTNSIIIAAPGATNSPQTINVSLTVNTSTTVNSLGINSGGQSYTNQSGTSYQADKNYSGGDTASTTAAISGTSDDALYKSVRYGNFSYNIPLTNGSYTVRFKFAEIYWDVSGRRVFNVSMQGTQVINNLDIFSKVGKNAAYDVTLPVSVTNGILHISFSSVADYAMVSAIEITGSELLPPPPPPPTDSTAFAANAGGGQYTGASGVVYQADTSFSGGYAVSTSANITGTFDDTLYQSVRYGNFTYNIPLANGNYNVTLRFAEIYWDIAGRRVFNVSMQGMRVISNLDIFSMVGKNAAYDVTFPVSVTNGTLNINFSSVSDYANVSAIEITQ